MSKGRKRKGNPVNGVVLLDKPLGMSSNHAVQRVKRLFNAQKAGHTGALDPLATGLLPVCLGEATKVSQYLLDADKGYYVKAQLGSMTTTGDLEGEKVKAFVLPSADSQGFEKVIESFIGEIEQVPPMYSALKHNGQPLYKLARKGKEIERKARKITIYSIDIIDYTQESFELQVRCSKGTYIRTLVEDIGKALDSGAFVLELRRTLAAPFSLDDCVSIEALESAVEDVKRVEAVNAGQALPLNSIKALQPVKCAIEHWPQVTLQSEQVHDLSFGRRITLSESQLQQTLELLEHNTVSDGLVGIFDSGAQDSAHTFLGIGRIEDGILIPQRLIQNEKTVAS